MTSLRIGVVCEGETDFIAVKHFLIGLLNEDGIAASIVALQPPMDNTRKGAGWPNMLNWLMQHTPDVREARFFGPQLFAGAIGGKKCDAIFVQMDTDILGQPDFEARVLRLFSYRPGNPAAPSMRAVEIDRLLKLCADMDGVRPESVNKHFFCPAVESTESWCVAAYNKHNGDPEELRGVDLYTAFMTALVESEGGLPKLIYDKCNKVQNRRERFCEKHKSGARRVYEKCAHFRQVYDQVKAVVS
jgi:hypothetical protein